MDRRVSNKRKVLRVATLVVVTALGWGAYELLSFELREVLPGRVYRSRQPDAADLFRAVGEAGIASVVNLRGIQYDTDWYLEELEASRRLGLERLDVRFESYQWPRLYSLHRLVVFLEQAPQPTLLHCHGGVHRAGLASAVARALEGEPVNSVRGELTRMRTSLRMANRGFINAFFDLYEEWLERNGRLHDAETFRHWALEIYCPPPFDADVRLLDGPTLERVSRGHPLQFDVAVTNLGAESWQLGPSGVHLGVRTFGPHAVPHPDPLRFMAWRQIGTRRAEVDAPTRVVGTGETIEFRVDAEAPDLPGHYILQIDLLDEESNWFSEFGKPGLLSRLEVVD
jgi:hypothetical protein